MEWGEEAVGDASVAGARAVASGVAASVADGADDSEQPLSTSSDNGMKMRGRSEHMAILRQTQIIA